MSARPHRILEVLYSYAIGGSQLLGLELARQLKDDGIEVLCAALDSTPGPLVAQCAKYGLPVVDLAVPWAHPLGRNGLSYGLAKRLRALQLDAVHLQHFLALNKLGLPARMAGVKRIVVTEHSVLDVSQSWAGRIRVRLNWRLASAITTVHPGIQEYLCTQLGVPAARVSVIPVGIDLKRYHRDDRAERRRALGVEGAFVFAFVGRFAPVKRVPELVEAFLAVQAQHVPPARLLLVGDGEDRAAVLALIGAHPLGERVILVGEQSDVRPYLAAADAFVLNSSSEGMPRALLEAMAAGLPALCPAVGHIPELIAGRGWLTDPVSRASLENTLRSVLEHPEVAEEAGRSSRTFVQTHFEAQAVAKRYRRLLLGEPATGAYSEQTT